jgi:hypothetical protein
MPLLLTTLKRHLLSQLAKLWNGNPETNPAPAIQIEEHKLVYIPIPKVACTSLHAMCVDLLGFRLPEGAWKAGVFRGHALDKHIDTQLRDRSSISVAQAAGLFGYWTFAATRNPFDRMVSCYSEKVCKTTEHKDFVGGLSKHFIRFGKFSAHMPFAEFVDGVCSIPDRDADPHFRSQHSFLTGRNGRLIPDYLCDIQELNLLTEKIEQLRGVRISIPHFLKSDRGDWQSYYTDELIRKVAARYREDFRLFGYETAPDISRVQPMP